MKIIVSAKVIINCLIMLIYSFVHTHSHSHKHTDTHTPNKQTNHQNKQQTKNLVWSIFCTTCLGTLINWHVLVHTISATNMQINLNTPNIDKETNPVVLFYSISRKACIQIQLFCGAKSKFIATRTTCETILYNVTWGPLNIWFKMTK